jgi:type I restriction enzyme M protein
MSDWGGDRLREDARWKFGVPPAGNANYAWVQHLIHHLAPTGVAGFVLANGSMSSNQSGEGEIRKAIIEADLVDCMVALPGQLFYSTQIPVCLWFLARDKGARTASSAAGKSHDRRRKVLFIDARKMGRMIDRVQQPYEDIPGFCKSATLDDIRAHGHVLTAGRYVGAADIEDDGEPFDQKMKRLTATLEEQFAESAKLERAIRSNLKSLDLKL